MERLQEPYFSLARHSLSVFYKHLWRSQQFILKIENKAHLLTFMLVFLSSFSLLMFMKRKGLSIRRKSNGNDTNMHRDLIPELIDKVIEQTDIILEILDSRFIEKNKKF